MKRMLAWILFALMLTGCGLRKIPEAAEQPPVAEEAVPAAETPKTDGAHLAFREILETVHDTLSILTDNGLQKAELFDGYSIENQGFAVADLDGDGEEELVVEIHDTFSAGMVLMVYNWDKETRTVRNTLSIFPYARFFANGNVQAFWSHNQGLAGDSLWPYTWITYDKEQDTYAAAADVDAWDRSYAETDYEGNPFPEEIDKDGAGVVYMIFDGEEQTNLSRSDFLAWETPLLTGSPELHLPWQKLTLENIAMVAADTAGEEVTLTRSDYLWQGQQTKVILKAGATGVSVFRDDGNGEKLVTAVLPKLLGIPDMMELDTTDLTDDGYSDLNVILSYPDGSTATVLWLSAGDTLYYNEEFSILPGELSPRGEE